MGHAINPGRLQDSMMYLGGILVVTCAVFTYKGFIAMQFCQVPFLKTFVCQEVSFRLYQMLIEQCCVSLISFEIFFLYFITLSLKRITEGPCSGRLVFFKVCLWHTSTGRLN